MEGSIEATLVDLDVRFEACACYQSSGVDVAVSACGWLEEDHGELAAVREQRRARRRRAVLPLRRAS